MRQKEVTIYVSPVLSIKLCDVPCPRPCSSWISIAGPATFLVHRSLDEIHGRAVVLAAPDQIIKDGKQHGATKHECVPVHALGSDGDGNREEDEDPNNEEEEQSTNVDWKTHGPKRPAVRRHRAAEPANDQAGEGNDISAQESADGEGADGVERCGRADVDERK